MFALDARYGVAQSDNTTVASWPDRSINGRNATQSTEAYKPKFRTNVTGGQPAMQFQAVANSIDRFQVSLTVTGSTVSCVTLGYMDSSVSSYARFAGMTKNGANDYDASTRAALQVRSSTTSNIGSQRNGSLANVGFSLGSWFHMTTVFDGTNCTNRINESTSASSASSGSFDVNQFRIGMSYDSTAGEPIAIGSLTGYVAAMSFFDSAISGPLRKRLQFAVAISFKVPI